jgi:hypothetical protein
VGHFNDNGADGIQIHDEFQIWNPLKIVILLGKDPTPWMFQWPFFPQAEQLVDEIFAMSSNSS